MRVLFVTDLIPIEEKENCAKALIPIIKELSAENLVEIIRPNFLLNSLIRGKSILPNGRYNCFGLNILNLNFSFPFLSMPSDINIEEYDEIIAHMPSGILFAERLLMNFKGEKSNLPKITYAVHHSDIHVMTAPLYLPFRGKMKTAYKNCDKIICRAPHLKEKIKKLLPETFSKIELQISKIPPKRVISDEEMFAKIKTYSGLKFITTANLIKRKNIALALKAFSHFKEHDFTFEIIGDGKELSALKRLTKSLKLEDKVKFSGKLSQEEVYTRLKDSNVFILPSVNETLGVAYLEAIASGCLVVGTKNTGVDGIIQDNINGFLCDPDEKSLVKTLKKVFTLTEEDFRNILTNRSLIELS